MDKKPELLPSYLKKIVSRRHLTPKYEGLRGVYLARRDKGHDLNFVFLLLSWLFTSLITKLTFCQ